MMQGREIVQKTGVLVALLITTATLAGCGGGGSASAIPATPITQAVAPTPGPRVAFLGDSWMAGVGVATSCYPRASMDSSACASGQNIADDVARDLHATAYQNLGLGGAYMYDAMQNEAPNIDATAQLVIVMVGFNDQKPLGDSETFWNEWSGCDPSTRTAFPDLSGNASCPYNEPYTMSMYNPQGFSETPPDMAARMAAIVAAIKTRAPLAKIDLVLPAHTYAIPEYSWSPAQDATYAWAMGFIDSAIANQGLPTIDLGGAQIYDSSNFVPKGTCPNPGVGDCGGHPNAQGAALIAQILADRVH